MPYPFYLLLLIGSVWLTLLSPPAAVAQSPVTDVIAEVQPKLVKIYGAGGKGRLEAYQSGFLISTDGWLLTARSYVLEAEQPLVVLHDGSRFPAEYRGHDPLLEIALLKIETDGLSFFDLGQSTELQVGERLLAFSNLYGIAVGREPASVLHGTVSARAPLTARQGTVDIPYRGEVYMIDAITNNPGAAGGAITNMRGELVAMIGKELQSAANNLWLNFALPIDAVRESVGKLKAGELLPRARMQEARQVAEPHTLNRLGLVLVPDVVANTPPFIDAVVPESLAERAGLLPDDLVLFIEGGLMTSCRAVRDELRYLQRDDPFEMTIQREQEVLTIRIDPAADRRR